MPNGRGPTFALVLILTLMTAGYAPALAHQATPAPEASPGAPSREPGVETLLQATLDEIPDLPVVVGLARWTYQPGAGSDLVVAGPEVYAVESGVLGIRVAGPATILRAGADSPEVATPGIDFSLQPGDQAVVATDVPHTLRNDGDEPARFLNVVIFPASSMIPSWLPDPETEPGTSIRNLFTDVIADADTLPAGPVSVALQRVTAAPDTVIPAPDLDGFALLLVESGTLGLELDEVEEQRSSAGEVVRLTPDMGRAARNAGDEPLVMLVLRILPAGTDVGIPTPATPSAQGFRGAAP